MISSSCWVYCCPLWAEISQTNLSLSPTVLSECCLHLLLAKWPKLCKNCCLWKHTEDTWKKTRTLFVTKLHMLGMLMGVDTENVPEYTRWYVRWLLATSFNRRMLTHYVTAETVSELPSSSTVSLCCLYFWECCVAFFQLYVVE